MKSHRLCVGGLNQWSNLILESSSVQMELIL
jgi:hypothetical protein